VQKIIIVFLILVGCGSKPQYREVLINKTVKVFSEDYHDQAENYTFKWRPPIGPNHNNIMFDLKNDMLIFTPETVGNYEVNLSIEDISEEVVVKEIFYFKAIPETVKVSIVESEIVTQPIRSTITKKKIEKQIEGKTPSKPVKTHNLKKQRQNPQLKHAQFAIQISAWPSLEEARKHQLELINEGFDAYTQRYYWQKRDEVWYRVRVGNFSNKNTAIAVKEQIESITNIATWLDIVN